MLPKVEPAHLRQMSYGRTQQMRHVWLRYLR